MAGGSRAHAALTSFAPLFWFRSPVERHPRLGHVQIAHLGWRFAEPHDGFKPVSETVARDAPRHVKWRFKAAKNWLILPVRLTEESARNGDDFSEAEVTVTKDQDLCILAAQDMDLILQAIEDAAP